MQELRSLISCGAQPSPSAFHAKLATLVGLVNLSKPTRTSYFVFLGAQKPTDLTDLPELTGLDKAASWLNVSPVRRWPGFLVLRLDWPPMGVSAALAYLTVVALVLSFLCRIWSRPWLASGSSAGPTGSSTGSISPKRPGDLEKARTLPQDALEFEAGNPGAASHLITRGRRPSGELVRHLI